ncbi:MAG: glycoside hydrolase, partial [Bacteroidales bacterium]|nr:glycoside hydrolase [Bacteroidales bacterium]
QMHWVKDLFLKLPYFDRVPDQSVFVGTYGEKYNRPIASRGSDYIVAYTYSGSALTIDLTKISGKKKHAWWYSPVDGTLQDLGEFKNSKKQVFTPNLDDGKDTDRVLVILDAEKDYLKDF